MKAVQSTLKKTHLSFPILNPHQTHVQLDSYLDSNECNLQGNFMSRFGLNGVILFLSRIPNTSSLAAGMTYLPTVSTMFYGGFLSNKRPLTRI